MPPMLMGFPLRGTPQEDSSSPPRQHVAARAADDPRHHADGDTVQHCLPHDVSGGGSDRGECDSIDKKAQCADLQIPAQAEHDPLITSLLG